MGATSHFVVRKTDHPGSTRREIEQEPNWGSGHNHRVGFKNKDNCVPGYADEARGKLSAYHARIDDGELVNFEDIAKAQEDLSLLHPENRSVGWRYVLDVTEEWVKYGQKWPANLEAEKKKKKEEAEKKEAAKSDEKGQNGHAEKPAANGHKDANEERLS